MTIEERVRQFLPTRYANSVSDEKIDAALFNAASIVMNTLRPFQNGTSNYNWANPVVPPRYIMSQVAIAVEILAKEGAQGQTSHSENSLTRVYEKGDISNSVLNKITPIAEVGG